jgi:hypothetical protein
MPGSLELLAGSAATEGTAARHRNAIRTTRKVTPIFLISDLRWFFKGCAIFPEVETDPDVFSGITASVITLEEESQTDFARRFFFRNSKNPIFH